MMIQLQNDFLNVMIHPKGAELQQLTNKTTGQELLWHGDPSYWGKFSPVLFPIVGSLRDNNYTYKDRLYTLPRHGFARDRIFKVVEQTVRSVIFLLEDDADTILNYPFSFVLKIYYELINMHLRITYEVINTAADGPLFFSIGAHPAFAVPLDKNLQFNDYYLSFEKDEPLYRWPLTETGLIQDKPVLFQPRSSRIQLDKSLFKQDAWVFKNLRSKSVSLLSDKSPHGWHVRWENFPFLGIWSTKNADFICIEPWCGIADGMHHDQELTRKEGIVSILPGEKWLRHWEVEPF